MSQPAAYEAFLELHRRGRAFVMPNPWDGGSAVLLAQAGFEAFGTSSIAIAYAGGRRDGAHAVSRDEAVENAALVAGLTGLPVNGDLEDGFGPSPEDCVATVEAAVAGGLAGLGIEDTTADPEHPIHEFDAAVRRIEAAAAAASGRIVLTARTDNFLLGEHDLEDTVRRLVAFAEAGADVVYAPGLPDLDAVRTVTAAVSPTPVNLNVGPASGPVPLSELEAAGITRVSLGGAVYFAAMQAVSDAAELLMGGDLPAVRRLEPATIGDRLPPAPGPSAPRG